MSQENDNLLAIFLEEAKDLLSVFSSTIQQWSKDLNNKHYFIDLKRDLHTLKGGARMVQQPELSALAHELESFCETLEHPGIQVDKIAYELVCQGLDQMHAMLESISKNEKVLPSDYLINKFKEKNLNESKKSIEQPQSLEAKPGEPINNQVTNEVIRVRADLLEKLNSLSIENNILRVNLGHHIDNFNTNLGEIYQLIKVLQEKIRMTPPEINFRVTSEMMALMNVCKALSQIHSNVESILIQQGRVALELQNKLIDTRMVPFDSVVPRLSRVTRQVASEVNKKVDFNVLATEGEIDRNLLEHLIPSLEHLLRNAIDHGIETPEVRIQVGKSENGKINLRFFRKGNDAGIEISDDGAGINVREVRKKAIRLGLILKDTNISDEEVIRYILEPGFSTRETINEISGRGVGMDVVNTVVKGLGGNLIIESKFGIGTKFIIKLPFTTSMNRALLVVIQGQTYGVLLSNVENIVLLTVKQVKELLNKSTAVFSYNNKEYQVKYLGAALGVLESPMFSNLKESFPVLLFDFPDYKAALLVDSLAGSQEVVVQTLGPQFKLMDTFSGATLLADGRVIIILDVYSITAKSAKLLMEAAEEQLLRKKQYTIMVVDDSVTIRTVTKNFLERHKYIVTTAKDGLDALDKIKIEKPDVILLDIEMPRMDGFKFAENIRSQPAFSNIPIIMITFCAGEEQRNLASKLGIQKFMSKPYQELELLNTIKQLLEDNQS
jgi:chemosensory pili system protein ChpA (sensor histidine kinase/response regulator)